MPKPNKVSWHSTGRWHFSKVVAGVRSYFYASPEIPNTPAGRRKATEWMKAAIDELADRVVTGQDWTLDDLRLAYLTWCKRRVAGGLAKPHTANGHKKHLNLICSTSRAGKPYGHLLAREMSTKIVGELVKTWKDAKLGATTIRNRIASLQAMLNWASQPRDDRSIERLTPINPIAGYALPAAEYQGDRYAPANEVGAFLDWVEKQANEREGARARFEVLTAKLIRFIAETGARPGEACALEWRHYDAGKRVFVLPPGEHKTGGKTKKPRMILLTPELVRMVDEIKADPERHPQFVFTHALHRCGASEDELRQGDPWNSNALSRKVRELRRKAIDKGKQLVDAKQPTDGLELIQDDGVKRMHLYRLRHTHITSDMESPEKPSIVDVAAMHGTSVKMIEATYLHHQIDHLHGVLERVRRASGDDVAK